MKFNKVIHKILHYISPSGKLSFCLSYIRNRNKLPNLRRPKDISEIWIRRVLQGDVNRIAYLADKFAVREYITSCGLGDILPKLFNVYSPGDDIDFNSLPDRFALKANWGAGKNIICQNKKLLNIEQVKQRISEWFKSGDYSYTEKHYNLIPRRVICEEFIDDGNGGFPSDYKFMCINGRVHTILVCSGRETGHAIYLPYSIDWVPMYEYYKFVESDIKLAPKPQNLEQMIDTAERIAKITDLVRVDLYSNGERIWFGEITLTPAGCIFHRWSQKALDTMGSIYYDNKQSSINE